MSVTAPSRPAPGGAAAALEGQAPQAPLPAPRSGQAVAEATSQSPAAVFLVRPRHFTPNPATLADNAFQSEAAGGAETVAARARAEVTTLAAALRARGIAVRVFDDASATRPDSVFPNNWVTTHADGTVCLYPLYAPNRRQERRADVLRRLREQFVVRRVIDYSPREDDGLFLEGTGAMVLDHVHRLAYACRSRRMDEELLEEFCADRGFTPVVFDAADASGVPIYHTNVMMSIGQSLALIGDSLILDRAQRERVLDSLGTGGRAIVHLDEEQIAAFAGNCLELRGSRSAVLAMSTTARAALTRAQLAVIGEHAEVVAVDVPTIESAGGSVRCMIAGNHLTPR